MKEQNKMTIWILSVLGGILLIAADQITKYMAVFSLKDQPSFPIIQGVFELLYVENRGAAFGILQNRQWMFVILTLIILAFLGWLFYKLPFTVRYLPLRLVAVGLTAGAVGNMIDRVRLGYVVDFFYFKLIDFPVFNVADIYVVVTIIVLAFLILFYYKEDELEQVLKR